MTPWTLAHQASLSMEFFLARILERVALPFSRGSFQTRGWTRVSCLHCIIGFEKGQKPGNMGSSRWEWMTYQTASNEMVIPFLQLCHTNGTRPAIIFLNFRPTEPQDNRFQLLWSAQSVVICYDSKGEIMHYFYLQLRFLSRRTSYPQPLWRSWTPLPY